MVKIEFEFEGENWDVYVCNMTIGGIDDTEGNAKYKINDGKWKTYFISFYICMILLIQQKKAKSLHKYDWLNLLLTTFYLFTPLYQHNSAHSIKPLVG